MVIIVYLCILWTMITFQTFYILFKDYIFTTKLTLFIMMLLCFLVMFYVIQIVNLRDEYQNRDWGVNNIILQFYNSLESAKNPIFYRMIIFPWYLFRDVHTLISLMWITIKIKMLLTYLTSFTYETVRNILVKSSENSELQKYYKETDQETNKTFIYNRHN